MPHQFAMKKPKKNKIEPRLKKIFSTLSFEAKMKRSEEDIKAGRTTKIEPADIWKLK
jgi:hypothetical protein